MQAAQFAHLCHVVHVHQEAIHGFLLALVQLGIQCFDCLQTLRHGHVVGVGVGFLRQHLVDLREQSFGKFTAQLDVHATASHVGGNRHGSKRACASDDERLFGVLAGVQDLVWDAAVEQGL